MVLHTIFPSVLFASVGLGRLWLPGNWTYMGETAPCFLPLDILFLQDSTQSFKDDLINVKNQMPDMIKAIESLHPGSLYAVSEFKDKPIPNFGWPDDDYCYRLAQPLTSRYQDVQDAYAQLYGSGGNDLPESSYPGIIQSFQLPTVGWRPQGTSIGEAGARLIILSTDALPHYSGDGSEKDLSYLPAWDPATVDITDMNASCTGVQYPNPDQVAAVVKEFPQQYVAILTPDDDSSVTGAWRWVNDDLFGQDPAMYQYISNDSSDFIDAVMTVIGMVTDDYCTTTTRAPTTTVTFESTIATTEAPTTEAPTTEAPTTVAPTTTPLTEAPTTAPTTTTTTAPTTSPTTAPKDIITNPVVLETTTSKILITNPIVLATTTTTKGMITNPVVLATTTSKGMITNPVVLETTTSKGMITNPVVLETTTSKGMITNPVVLETTTSKGMITNPVVLETTTSKGMITNPVVLETTTSKGMITNPVVLETTASKGMITNPVVLETTASKGMITNPVVLETTASKGLITDPAILETETATTTTTIATIKTEHAVDPQPQPCDCDCECDDCDCEY